MNKRKQILVLLLMLMHFVGWAQEKNYYGQHVSIKQTTGDSIQYDLSQSSQFRPVIKDGRVTWSFQNFSLDDVHSIDFRSVTYDEEVVREALIEFYNIMDGANWARNDNWCSDKPIWEWYGINWCLDGTQAQEYPWVAGLWFNCAPIDKPESGNLPECIQRMGPIIQFALPVSNLTGELPAFLGNIYSLQVIILSGNNLSGTFPLELSKLPNLDTFVFENNQVEGPLPEEFILSCMNRSNMPGNNFNIANNNFSGKVPVRVQQHPRFADFWPGIVIQNTPLDVTDLVIPAPTFCVKDIDGNIIDLAEIYKKNKYTLLYKWGWWCPFSEAFNQQLIPAYKGYKDKGLEVIGVHYAENEGLPNYLMTNDIPWTNTYDYDWGEHDAIFQWAGTPQVYLVDQNGNIVFNSLMDNEGNCRFSEAYRDQLFPYLEERLGKIDYHYYTSTDYSRDGEVTTLQAATVGQGVDLVFVGEGFTDKAIDDGMFDRRMLEAMEQFFAYEPYTALRDRFNVYAVKAVSPNAEFVDGCTHAIDEDPAKALRYAQKVTTLIPDRPMHVTVVYNQPSGGRSYCMMMEDNSYVCYTMDGVTNVLNHESGGHGIGRLLDEYVESGNEGMTLPEESKTLLDDLWVSNSWGANVDWHSDPSEVKWAKFISDTRYADEQTGCYEGAYLYPYGAYRPTQNSMMRYNDTPFNAPSREEIYKRVMRESEGDGWTYDYETFVNFDAPGRQQFVNALANAGRKRETPQLQHQHRTAQPVMLKGTWHDAVKK